MSAQGSAVRRAGSSASALVVMGSAIVMAPKQAHHVLVPAVWAAVVGWPVPALADSVTLQWTRLPGAEGCPSAATLEARVSERLGREPFALPGEPSARQIRAEVRRQGNLWEATLRERSPRGTRERHLNSTSPTCDALSDAVTLALALLIDPQAALGIEPEPEPLPTPDSTPVAKPECEPCPPTEEPQQAVRSMEVSAPPPVTPPPPPQAAGIVEAQAVLALGILPRGAPGISLAAEIGASFRARFGIYYLPEQRTDDGGFAFGLSAAFLGACASFEEEPARLQLCSTFQLGSVHAVVYELEPLEPGALPWLAFDLGPSLTLALSGSLTLGFGVDAVVPLTRYEYRVQARDEPIFAHAPVGVLAHAGLGWEWR